MRITQVSGKPTETRALAAEFVDELLVTLTHAQEASGKTVLGVVTATSVGPPATLTATVHGRSVANIRYTGSTPSNGDTVVLQYTNGTYVAVGVLS